MPNGRRAFDTPTGRIWCRSAGTGAGTVLIDPVNHGADPLSTLAPVAEVLATDEWVLHAADQDLPCLAEIGMTPHEALRHRAGRPAGRVRPGEPGRPWSNDCSAWD